MSEKTPLDGVVSSGWAWFLAVPYRLIWAFVLGKHFEWFGPPLGLVWGFPQAFCVFALATVYEAWRYDVNKRTAFTLGKCLFSPIAAAMLLLTGWLFHLAFEALR